jgi:hypothetical protein
MVSKSPRRIAAPEPQNQSRASGAAAPASAAATAPRQAPGFYDADAAPAPREGDSGLAAFADTVRQGAVELDDDVGGDRDVVLADVENQPLSERQQLLDDIERVRAMRRPIGSYQLKLALPKRHGYYRHWFNDVAGRIDDATANGWAHVLGKDNQPLNRVVGAGRDGGAVRAYAMEIPLVFWQEDQDHRHKTAAEKLAALKAQPFRAPQGTAKQSDKGKFYDPSEHDAGPLQVVKS